MKKIKVKVKAEGEVIKGKKKKQNIFMKEVWEKKYKGKSPGIKGKKGYSEAKNLADKKFGKSTSLVKNLWISQYMKKNK